MMFVMPFHALSFSFQLKVDAANKVVAFDSILFHQPRGNIFFTEVCAPPSGSEKCSRHNLSSIPNFVPFPGPHGMLFKSLLPFP
jgi:hypothetical protein